MLIVLLLSLTLLITIATHSILLVLLWMLGVVVLSIRGVWKYNMNNLFLSIIVIIVSYCAVLWYDVRVGGAELGYSQTTLKSQSENFLVTSRSRMGRYIIESYPEGESSNTLLLYSSQSLLPGDVISISKTPIPREYKPIMCRWICYTTDISSRNPLGNLINIATNNNSYGNNGQSGQVLDNVSYSLFHSIDNSLNSLFQDKEFDYDGRLYMQGIDGSLYDNTTKIEKHISIGPLVQVRNNLFHTITDKFGETIQAGLVLGMTIGDKSLISQERYDQFIDSGLVHLIAVSGGNIAIIVLFFSFLLFWLPFYMRQIVLIGAVVGYALIVGGDTSVIRATIMGLLTIIVLFPGRQLSIWRSLAYARCGMLLYNPYYLLYDMGFLLSFGAIVGIIWGERKYKLLFTKQDNTDIIIFSPSLVSRMRKLMQSFTVLYIVPTIGAIVGVLPLLLWSMGQINIATPFVNILIVPFVPLITIVGFIVGMLPVGRLSHIGEWLLSMMMNYILWLSVIGTRYALIVEVKSWLKILLLIGVMGYWVYWIDKQKE